MKIGFIGFGSIAKRHINNLHTVFRSCNEPLIIDIFRSSKCDIPDEYKNKINNAYLINSKVEKSYDAIFITNPTSMHYDTLKNFIDYANAFFIEKPVFNTYEKDLSVFPDNKIYYVACPLRYNAVIQYVKNNIDFKNVYSIRAISSSYLPDWRPNTDYRNTYSAHKNLGGGVAIDLIHEWDYLTYLIGFPNTVYGFLKKESNLEIDCEDIAIYIAEYAHKTVELHLDYFGRCPMRMLELYSDKDTIKCDLINSTIHFLKNDHSIDFKEDRDVAQIRELQYFFNIINGSQKNENTISTACKTLKLTEGKII